MSQPANDDISALATQTLRVGLGKPDAELHPNQLTVIQQLLRGENTLCIDKTGAGKSETYFVTSILMRQRDPSAGPIIVVTPLVPLIRDQERRAQAFHAPTKEMPDRTLAAYGIYGELDDFAKSNVLIKLASNQIDILFLTAEMLDEISQDQRTFINPKRQKITYTPKILSRCPILKRHPPDVNTIAAKHIPLLVIDEIHYIAEVGHDFRLDYSRVWNQLLNHPWYKSTCKLGLTATVTKRVRASLEGALPEVRNWTPVLGNLYRKNITIRIMPKPVNDNARLDYVYQLHRKDMSCFILVFCKKIDEVKQFAADFGRLEHIDSSTVGFYYAPKKDTPDTERDRLLNNEKGFRTGKIRVLFSTCALGLGYDKSDIHHVVHLWTPNSLVQYYQEYGRAGRANGSEAVAHMLPTSVWTPTGWVAVLASICWFLARSVNSTASVVELQSRAEVLRHKSRDFDTALKLGKEKGLLVMDNTLTNVRLAKAETLVEVDQMYAKQMEEEVALMYRLSHNMVVENRCIWETVLHSLEGEQLPNNWKCGTCSSQLCRPGGDIEGSSQAGDAICYKLITGYGIPVYAINKVGEDLMIDDEKLVNIFFTHQPTMLQEPPAKWTICPIPDSKGRNLKIARTISEWLHDMPVQHFIAKNENEHRTVTGATSRAERLDILTNKFIFDDTMIPQVGNVLLLDDKVSSGDTIDSIAKYMKSKAPNLGEIVALTQFVFIGSKVESPAVMRIRIADPNGAAIEQEAQ